MNEKLKQEIRDYIGAQKSDVFHDVAEHFYNFALEEVRKKINEHREWIDSGKCEFIEAFKVGARDSLKELANFIDNLTK